MKKRIFFVMSTDDVSGAELVNFNIIKMLSKKYEFFWVSKEGNINGYLKEQNIKWIKINKLCISEIKRIIKEYKPDILHATDYKASTITAFANKNVILIEHIHNNAPWIKTLCLKSILFYIAALKSNYILTVSNSIAREYIFAKYIYKKIINIGNPTSVKSITTQVTSNDFIKKYDICCAARITKAKNPYLFLDIIFNIKLQKKNIKVIWIGSGDLENEVIAYCKKLNLQNNIKFIGKKKNPYKYMASSKLFLLTSSWEGYGLAAFEALALGLPCIVSNVGGLPEIVDEKCGFICDSKNEYVKSINKILDNELLYNKLSNGAKAKANKLNNIKKYIKNIDEIYEEAVKK